MGAEGPRESRRARRGGAGREEVTVPWGRSVGPARERGGTSLCRPLSVRRSHGRKARVRGPAAVGEVRSALPSRVSAGQHGMVGGPGLGL